MKTKAPRQFQIFLDHILKHFFSCAETVTICEDNERELEGNWIHGSEMCNDAVITQLTEAHAIVASTGWIFA